jgi:threonine/homoserine/homoserine lactone efflux protein
LVGGLGRPWWLLRRGSFGGLNTYLEALLLVISVMGGSLLWWLGLSELIATIRHRLTESRLKLINRIAGVVLMGFGLVLLLDGLVRYFH